MNTKTIELRPYQLRIVESIGESNAIVKMPTGSGKTYIGIELMKRSFRRDQSFSTNISFLSSLVTMEAINEKNIKSHDQPSTKRKGLFLVPTCELVTQQAKAIREWGFCTVAEYMGGARAPGNDVDVIVSTPQAFLSLQAQASIFSKEENPQSCFSWENICICVFDEVHHVLKDHPYRKIALRLQEWNAQCLNPFHIYQPNGDKIEKPLEKNQRVQIIGLSASLTYSVVHDGVESCLRRLCRELGVEKMECPTIEELAEGGFKPACAQLSNNNSSQYNIEIIKADDVPEGVIPASSRQAHCMHEMFFERAKKSKATPFAQQLYNTIEMFEKQAKEMYHDFVSPLDTIKLTTWENYAHDLINTINLEMCANESKIDWLFTPKQAICLFRQMETYYVALRMIVQSWEEGQSLVARWLNLNDAFSIPPWTNPDLQKSISDIKALTQDERYINYKKINNLKKILLEKIKSKKNFRGIVFVQQRITAFILAQYVSSDSQLKHSGILAGFITARQSRLTPSLKISKSVASDQIRFFKEGKINLLFATSVIEEGFDVPEANVIITYDHLKDSVELCQRFGRARAKESSIVVMAERKDRPIEKLEQVRQRQDVIIQGFYPNSNEEVISDSSLSAQNQREAAAGKSVLKNEFVCVNSPLQALKMYVDKTKAILDVDVTDANGCYKSSMRYKSSIRDIQVTQEATSKKKAKIKCASDVLERLKNATKY